MKRILISFILSCLVIISYSQSLSPAVNSSQGVTGTTTSFIFGSTVGQNVNGYGNTGSYNIVQGFNQPYGSFILDTLATYTIGNILPQNAWYDGPTQFYIRCDSSQVHYKIKATPDPTGTLKMDSIRGKFYFLPDAPFRDNFDVEFMAITPNDTIRQTVPILMMPSVPMEQEYFGVSTNKPLPEEDSNKYVTLTRFQESQSGFNYHDRDINSYAISGKTLIFDNSIENSCAPFVGTGLDDIKELNIYAETVIIRDELNWRQTDVKIYARCLKFEDKAGQPIAAINTMPVDYSETYGDKDGLKGGNINLYLEEIIADKGNRFRTIGGSGQNNHGSNTPGNGGDAGDLFATIDVNPFIDLVGGAAGCNNSTCGTKGNYGSYTTENRPYGWLHPFIVDAVIRHAKDAYIDGHNNRTAEILSDYALQIETFKENKSEWETLAIEHQCELNTFQNEIQVILHRLGNGMDYFGNPPGWVPMLSFEVNKMAFEEEIEKALKVMYLARYMKHFSAENDKMINASQQAIEEKKGAMADWESKFNEATSMLPGLQAEADDIATRIDNLQIKLTEKETELAERARYTVENKYRPKPPPKKSWWRKATGWLGTALKFVPYPGFSQLGIGLQKVSKINFNKPMDAINTIGDATEKFRGVDFAATTDSISNMWDNLNPANVNIKWSEFDITNPLDPFKPAANYVKRINNLSKSVNSAINKINGYQYHGKQKPPSPKVVEADLKAILADLKAQSSEYQNLVTNIEKLLNDKKLFHAKINDMMQQLGTATNEIESGILAINGLNHDVFEGKCKRDLRAMQYVEGMDQRARTRLLKYHYYMSKAYEYRTLQEYPEKLDIMDIFDQMANIIDTSRTSNHIISVTDLNFLKSVYEKQISTVAETILDEYNTNRPELSAPIRFNLSGSYLDELNSNGNLNLNLVELGFFPAYEENIRIVDFKVVEMQVHYENGTPSMFAYTDINLEHSGISKLKQSGEVFQFNHYNENNENPIVWGIRYDVEEGLVNPKEPSAASESLLYSILEGLNSTSDVMIYSRPAAWADLSITKKDVSNNNLKIVIDKLRLELRYDFKQRPVNLVNIEVITNDGLLPYYRVDRMDNNNRQDGWGHIHRSYHESSTGTTTITTPENYGIWKFTGWTDRYGNPLTTLKSNPVDNNNSITLDLNADIVIKANYEKQQPILAVMPDTIYVSKQYGSNSFLIQNEGNDLLEWSVTSLTDWISIPGDPEGFNEGSLKFNFEENQTGSDRTGILEILATNSEKYLDTVMVVQKATLSSGITINYPSTKDEWLIGSEYIISWSEINVDLVNVYLYKDGKKINTLVQSTNRNSLVWTVPSLEKADAYQIRVESTVNSSVFGESELFSITDVINSISHFNTDDIEIYPNPVEDILHVNINRNLFGESIKLNLYNYSGQQVLNYISQSNSFDVDLSLLTIGVYYINIQLNGKTIKHKILKK